MYDSSIVALGLGLGLAALGRLTCFLVAHRTSSAYAAANKGNRLGLQEMLQCSTMRSSRPCFSTSKDRYLDPSKRLCRRVLARAAAMASTWSYLGAGMAISAHLHEHHCCGIAYTSERVAG